MDVGTSTDYLIAKLERCKEDLNDAHEMFDNGKYRLCVNRAYYSVFHIVSATLAAMGHERSKHSGVEAAFHRYLVKPGLVSSELAVTYKLARKTRENADYELEKRITEEMAQDLLNQCEHLVKQVEQYLYSSGTISEKH